MKRLSQKKTFIFLAFLVVMWGLNWPLTKIGLLYAPPLLFAGIRTFIGGLILLMFAIPRYKNLHLKETWHIYLISAVLNIILYYGLMTFGLIYMPAGLFSAIVFLQPVLLGVFSWMWLGESMFTLKIIGFDTWLFWCRYYKCRWFNRSCFNHWYITCFRYCIELVFRHRVYEKNKRSSRFDLGCVASAFDWRSFFNRFGHYN